MLEGARFYVRKMKVNSFRLNNNNSSNNNNNLLLLYYWLQFYIDEKLGLLY